MPIKIEVFRRLFSKSEGIYCAHARIVGKPECCADARSFPEAVGVLIQEHPDLFGVRVEFPEDLSR